MPPWETLNEELFCHLQIQADPSSVKILPPSDQQPEISDGQADAQQRDLEEQSAHSLGAEGDLPEEEQQPEQEPDEAEETFRVDRYDLLFLPFRVTYRRLDQPSQAEGGQESHPEEPQQLQPAEDNEAEDQSMESDNDGDGGGDGGDEAVPLHKMSTFDYVEHWLGPEAAAAMWATATQPPPPAPSANQVLRADQ